MKKKLYVLIENLMSYGVLNMKSRPKSRPVKKGLIFLRYISLILFSELFPNLRL